MSEVNRLIWHDGEFVKWAEATVHVLSQSLQRGSLAFDYMSVHPTTGGQAVLKLPEHIDRLLKTCAIMGIPITYSKNELVAACVATVGRNPGSHSLKISALIPSIEVELVPQDPKVSVFIAAYDSLKDVIERNPGKHHVARNLSLKIERTISNRQKAIIPPQAKIAANYTAPMFAKWRARKEGFDDILLLDGEFIAEAPTSNIFAVVNGGLVTPPARRVLHGITRASIIELAQAMGLRFAERDITVDELLGADEVFLTATSIGVWPVIKIDDVTFTSGAIGLITQRLQTRHTEIAAGEDAAFAHWLTLCPDHSP
jgi:branched-chain amino acid aminotransferase